MDASLYRDLQLIHLIQKSSVKKTESGIESHFEPGLQWLSAYYSYTELATYIAVIIMN